MDKNLEEPFSEGFSRDRAQIGNQLLPDQRDRLLDLLVESPDLWPSASIPIGGALAELIPVETNKRIDLILQPVQRSAQEEKDVFEKLINQFIKQNI